MLLISTETLNRRPPRIFWPLLVLGIVLAAESATAFILNTILRQGFMAGANTFYIAAPLAALLVGIPAWVRFLILPQKVTPGRGAALGAVCSLIAHPVMWISIWLIGLSQPGLFSGDAGMVVVVVFYSLLIGGWITTPIGAIAGALLAWLQIGLTNVPKQRISRQILANRRHEMDNKNNKSASA